MLTNGNEYMIGDMRVLGNQAEIHTASLAEIIAIQGEIAEIDPRYMGGIPVIAHSMGRIIRFPLLPINQYRELAISEFPDWLGAIIIATAAQGIYVMSSPTSARFDELEWGFVANTFMDYVTDLSLIRFGDIRNPEVMRARE